MANPQPKRVFHQDVASNYALPNDSPEHQRLEEQALHWSNTMQGQIIHAPISPEKTTHILDVGCGTGIVTDTLAAAFHNARVYGLDISPVPQTLRKQRENVTFLLGNVLTSPPTAWTSQPGHAGLTKDEGVFDLIFSRLLIAGMSDWPAYLRTELSMLKPGGYVEMHDLDERVYDASGAVISDGWEWHGIVSEMLAARGLDQRCGTNAKRYALDAGFVDVEVKEYKMMIGGEGATTEEERAAGEFHARNMMEVYEVLIGKAMEGKDISEGVAERYLEDMRRGLKPEKGKFLRFPVTLGRKPL